MTFGQKTSICRKEQKLSQAELGKRSGINSDIIGKYERDEMKPSIETEKKLSDALAVSLDYLVGDGDLKVVDKKQCSDYKILRSFQRKIRPIFFMPFTI